VVVVIVIVVVIVVVIVDVSVVGDVNGDGRRLVDRIRPTRRSTPLSRAVATTRGEPQSATLFF
jgi:hypothetical protein